MAYKPQTQRDPTGGSPPLETDPRAVKCTKHEPLLYPGEICGRGRDEQLNEQFELAPPGEQVFSEQDLS